MKMSRELHEFCRKCIYELAINYNENLLNHIEYEECFEKVMHSLNVPSPEKEGIFENILSLANFRHVSYHQLSPLNQFLVAIPGYVFFCLKNRLTGNEQLSEEAETLMEDPIFPRYLQQAIGLPVSKEIRGAFYRPGFFGYLFLFLLIGAVTLFVFHLHWWLSLLLGLITTVIVFIIISNLNVRPRRNPN